MPEPIAGESLYRWRQWAIQLAQSNEIDPYEVDWFIQGFTHLNQLSLQTDTYREQPSLFVKCSLFQLSEHWQQRVTDKVPVQYLVGETPWRTFTISVTPDVLIPRPETELIIDLAKTLVDQSPCAEQRHTRSWADLGTGSGAIALGLATTFSKAVVHAVDVSEKALEVAQHNARNNCLSDRIIFYQGNWFEPLSSLKGELSGIVSNPPYIPSQTVFTLQPEVANHEPHVALDGGENGLSCIQILISEGADYLCSGGLWLTELMDGQAEAVASLLKAQGSYTNISIHKDLSGIERFVSAYKAL